MTSRRTYVEDCRRRIGTRQLGGWYRPRRRSHTLVQLCDACAAILRAAEAEGGHEAVRSIAAEVIYSCCVCSLRAPPRGSVRQVREG